MLRHVADLATEHTRRGVLRPTGIASARERRPRRAYRLRQCAPVVVETDERVPTLDEVAERERDVDPVARADRRAFPREAIRERLAVRRMRVEDRAARH